MLVKATERYAFGWSTWGSAAGWPRASRPTVPDVLDVRVAGWDHVLRGWDMALRPDERRAILGVLLRRQAVGVSGLPLTWGLA